MPEIFRSGIEAVCVLLLHFLIVSADQMRGGRNLASRWEESSPRVRRIYRLGSRPKVGTRNSARAWLGSHLMGGTSLGESLTNADRMDDLMRDAIG